VKKSSTPNSTTQDNMSHTPVSPAITVPFADIVMDVNSNLDAKQAAWELAQAQERVRATQETQEKRREEWKRQEEERKAKIVAAIKLAVEQAAELAVDREQRILLQVSLRFLWLEPEVDLRKEEWFSLVPAFIDTGVCPLVARVLRMVKFFFIIFIYLILFFDSGKYFISKYNIKTA